MISDVNKIKRNQEPMPWRTEKVGGGCREDDSFTMGERDLGDLPTHLTGGRN